jgi:hypothetical protein
VQDVCTDACFDLRSRPLRYTAAVVWMSLTLALIVDATLRFRLELGLDLVQQLIESLGRADLGASHDTGRVVVHGRGMYARVYVEATIDSRWTPEHALSTREQRYATVVSVPAGRKADRRTANRSCFCRQKFA